jgi:hypothetical protein
VLLQRCDRLDVPIEHAKFICQLEPLPDETVVHLGAGIEPDSCYRCSYRLAVALLPLRSAGTWP